MTMQLKSTIMDEAALRRSMMRITHEIIEKNNGTGFVSGTWESIRSRNKRKTLKDQKDGAIATFVLEKDIHEK